MSAATGLRGMSNPFALASATGFLAQGRTRIVLSATGIALGVAMAAAVHLINASALAEFSAAMRSLTGEADLSVSAGRQGFAESLYPQLARLPGVAAASPAVRVQARLADGGSLELAGLDPFRAAQVQPGLLGESSAAVLEVVETGAVLLSPAAAARLGVKVGQSVRFQTGLEPVPLRVAALLPPGRFPQPLAVMDIAHAQWRFGQLGRLQRIDLRLAEGADRLRVKAAVAALLPPGTQVSEPAGDAERAGGLSRAYRVNMNVLALVALFTGAFLVFATQALSVLRRRRQLALLRALGVTRRGVLALLLAEGAALGAIGSALGVALGWALAGLAVARLGGDLGAGYFRGMEVALRAGPFVLAGFFALGLAMALAGSLLPALEAARTPPAAALHAGDQERPLGRLARWGPGLALLGLGAALVFAPPADGVPLAGYLAIALLLTGAVALVPALLRRALGLLPPPRWALARLALAQLQGAAGQTAVSLAAVLVSFSLTAAMAVMVWSFRQSLEDWLTRVLPADLYVNVARDGSTGYFDERAQAVIAATPGVARADFVRRISLLLAPDHPPVTLLARPTDLARPDRSPPLVGPVYRPAPGEPPPAYVSEAVADLYAVAPSGRITLPLADRAAAFTVAGIWRDYVRQTGAVVIDRALYVQLTGDTLASDAALYLAPGADPDAVAESLRERLPGGFETGRPAQIRAESLRIFDRTFAATYALEAVALLVGLFGVSIAFSAQVLARRAEFGMLRHIGMTRGEVARTLALEGAAVGALGVGGGLLLGFAVSLILIHVVNRQSFHWSMDLAVPWGPLAAFSAVVLAATALTAVLSARSAMGGDVVHAVREDW